MHKTKRNVYCCKCTRTTLWALSLLDGKPELTCTACGTKVAGEFRSTALSFVNSRIAWGK